MPVLRFDGHRFLDLLDEANPTCLEKVRVDNFALQCAEIIHVGDNLFDGPTLDVGTVCGPNGE